MTEECAILELFIEHYMKYKWVLFHACFPQDITKKVPSVALSLTYGPVKQCLLQVVHPCSTMANHRWYYKDPDPYYTDNSSNSHRLVIDLVHHTLNIIHIKGAA